MQLTKWACALGMTTIILAAQVQAVDQGQGKVSMQGRIIDTPCAIKVDSRDQVIDLFTLPLDQIFNAGAGPSNPFSIQTENCALELILPNYSDRSHFRSPFDGVLREGSRFALHGEPCGIGLGISNAAGFCTRFGSAAARRHTL